MDLKDYINKRGIPITKFARLVKVSAHTIHNILNGYDMRLSIASRIEELTEGAVTCQDLAKGLQQKSVREIRKAAKDKKQKNGKT